MYRVEREFHGRKYVMESGRMAKQAGGSVIISQGDSMVLVTSCAGAEKDGDFLPLTVDYVEKTYAAGKIPGGFFRREGKLTEREILVSRLIDRPCRPLFKEGYRHDTQVLATVISVDDANDPDVLAVTGASASLMLAGLPFEGPISCVRVGRIKGKLVINPTRAELTHSDINMIVAGSRDAIVMVEGGSNQVPEADIVEALFYAQQELQVLNQMQEELCDKCGKPQMEFKVAKSDEDLTSKAREFAAPEMSKAIRIKEKLVRRDAMGKVKQSMLEKFVDPSSADAGKVKARVEKVYEDLFYDLVRKMVLTEKTRIDGRDTKTVRAITIEAGLLPRAHGSSLFTRGETQALVVATLGTQQEAQRLDSLMGEESKTFMLHYNFPPFSVGEVKMVRGPGRREIGHGALAERAITYVLPDEKSSQYVVRVVSEILESNGSSSMATVCGTSLALMDAGIQISAPVAGVAMGLISEGHDYAILTDILGDEDHLGDMDFKVCGTQKGITALQMDIKIKGLKRSIVEEAMYQAREGRLYVLEQMNQVLAKPRVELSQYAPRIITLKIKTDKVRDVIGPGGKTIRSIQESCSVKIDIDDSGLVNIFAVDQKRAEEAAKIVRSLTEEAEVGKIYRGIVKKITDFGAFVEILPGTSGLLHISQLADGHVREVTDVVQEGDEVMVKVLDVDRMGKIRLSRKEAMLDLKDQGQAA